MRFRFPFGIFIALIGAPALAFAQATITISPALPGALSNNGTSVAPGAFIVNFYQYALFVAGLLAFGAIVYGGIRYAWARGNPSGETEARQWIWSALLGLLLLVGAYIILYTINPNLVNLSLGSIPNAPAVSPAVTGGGGTPPPSGTPPAVGCTGSSGCKVLSNCTPSSRVNCGAAAGMNDTMNCIQSKDPGLSYKVTEGYPPTVAHTSPGHNNGCSIDVQVSGGANTCSAIAGLQAAAVACGAAKPLNEYASCNGTTYKTTTGNNVHINAIKGDGGC
jgi:hypothetical protein